MNKDEIIRKCLKEGVLRVRFKGEEFFLVRDWKDLTEYKGFTVPLVEFREVTDFARYLRIRKMFTGVFGSDIKIYFRGGENENSV